MDSGRWNGNNWALVGPNGEPVKVRQSQRVNEWPPARRVSGFNTTSPRGNKPSTVVANEPSTGVTAAAPPGRTSALTINLAKGPRNILTLLANANIPGFVKEGLRQVLFNKLITSNKVSIEQISLLIETVGFNNNQKRELRKAMYRKMATQHLALLANTNRLARNVLNERAVPSGKP